VAAYFSTRHVTISVLSGLTLFFILLGSPLVTTAIAWMAHRTEIPGRGERLIDELAEFDKAEDADGLGQGSGREKGMWRDEREA
jgi:multisubunit Na+/H+ antiporter MnhG subunit